MTQQRRIDVELDGAAPIDLASLDELLARAYDSAYRLTLIPNGARAEFMSIGGPQPAFAIVAAEHVIAIDLTSVERDYCAAATVAEELARRHDGRAVDRTTGVRLWPPVDGGATHPTIARARLSFEIDEADCDVDGDNGRLMTLFLETAHRHWPAVLPRCFSDREPFLCETPGNESAFVALCHRTAREGGTVSWLATLPALDGYATWPRRTTLFPSPIRLELGVAAAALDEARPFVAALAVAIRARSSVTTDGGAIQLRLGTSWVVDPGRSR